MTRVDLQQYIGKYCTLRDTNHPVYMWGPLQYFYNDTRKQYPLTIVKMTKSGMVYVSYKNQYYSVKPSHVVLL